MGPITAPAPAPTLDGVELVPVVYLQNDVFTAVSAARVAELARWTWAVEAAANGSGSIDPNGRYEILVGTSKTLPPGEYVVTVVSTESIDGVRRAK